jgi:plasmid stabilization system protein ParE
VRIEWSSAAIADLQAITEWIEQDRGIETANRIARRIYEAVQSLRTMPYRGRYGVSKIPARWSFPGFRISPCTRFSNSAWLCSMSCMERSGGRSEADALAAVT